jgi:hypothetical protein
MKKKLENRLKKEKKLLKKRGGTPRWNGAEGKPITRRKKKA